MIKGLCEEMVLITRKTNVAKLSNLFEKIKALLEVTYCLFKKEYKWRWRNRAESKRRLEDKNIYEKGNHKEET